jgi:hypothetical protein
LSRQHTPPVLVPASGGDAVPLRPLIQELHQVSSLDDPADRKAAFAWLAERVNTYVNVLRPLVRSAAADYRAANEG